MSGGESGRIALRACLVVVLMSALTYTCGPGLLSRALPLLEYELRVLDGVCHDHRLRVATAGADTVVRVDARVRPAFVLAGRVFEVDEKSTASVTMLAGHAYQPLVLAVALAFAWPAPNRRMRAARTLLALVLALFIAAVDLPVVLAAELWEILRDAAVPGEQSIIGAWKSFLESGGRLCLGIAAGAIAVSAVRAPVPRVRVHPCHG